jgi:hypothetical protein
VVLFLGREKYYLSPSTWQRQQIAIPGFCFGILPLFIEEASGHRKSYQVSLTQNLKGIFHLIESLLQKKNKKPVFLLTMTSGLCLWWVMT